MSGRAAVPEPDDITSGIAQVEGYLLAQAALRTARTEGQAFAARMPWLTSAQSEEVARHFTQAHLEVTKAALRTVRGRCAELRAEYTARYERLRYRLLCATAAALLSVAALYAGLLLGLDAAC
ncbi:hypothetical protein [Streptomyces sp. NPDC018031]|uniref:hypothetical protein n=1 Tax=Streptomyces sp. NPDC018031 TaxID=3365033 RepID=UPI0037BA71F7